MLRSRRLCCSAAKQPARQSTTTRKPAPRMRRAFSAAELMERCTAATRQVRTAHRHPANRLRPSRCHRSIGQLATRHARRRDTSLAIDRRLHRTADRARARAAPGRDPRRPAGAAVGRRRDGRQHPARALGNDRWTAEWSARRTALCELSMRSDRDQSAKAVEQLQCLERRLTHLDGAITACTLSRSTRGRCPRTPGLARNLRLASPEGRRAAARTSSVRAEPLPWHRSYPATPNAVPDTRDLTLAEGGNAADCRLRAVNSVFTRPTPDGPDVCEASRWKIDDQYCRLL